MLPNDTILGELTIIEIYEYVNMPVLFACKNRTGHLFMATWIDETAEHDQWLYTPISLLRFSELRQSKIDLHTAFSQPADHHVFLISIPKSGNSATVERIITANIPADWFPLPNDYLKLPDELPPIIWDNIDQTNITTYESTMLKVGKAMVDLSPVEMPVLRQKTRPPVRV